MHWAKVSKIYWQVHLLNKNSSFLPYFKVHGVIVFDTPWRWGYYHQSLSRIMTSETDEVLMLILSLYMLYMTTKNWLNFERYFVQVWEFFPIIGCGFVMKVKSAVGFPSLLGIKTGRWLIHSLKQSKMVRKMQNIG